MITTATVDTTRCCVCDAEIVMRAERVAQLRANGADFYCPNGHVLSYRPTTLEKVQAERDRLAKELAAEKARPPQRGFKCPLCTRSFLTDHGRAIHHTKMHGGGK